VIRALGASSIGKKQVTALTGLLLIGFLIVHLAGNLLIFVGPAAFNHYSHSLIHNPLIIPAEVALALIFIVHIGTATRVQIENRRARPVPYARVRSRGRPSRRTFGSQTMIVTGFWVLVFLVLHIMTFKFGPHYTFLVAGVPEVVNGHEVRDLYRLVLEVFGRPGYVAWYVASMVALGLHLQHGAWSLFETFGLDHPRYTPWIVRGGRAFGWIMALAYMSIPLAVYFGGAPRP
jgi:succinate dehydrogenase / fumarate reductase cytochrome b subunit